MADHQRLTGRRIGLRSGKIQYCLSDILYRREFAVGRFFQHIIDTGQTMLPIEPLWKKLSKPTGWQHPFSRKTFYLPLMIWQADAKLESPEFRVNAAIVGRAVDLNTTQLLDQSKADPGLMR
jgi:hypothetical protein